MPETATEDTATPRDHHYEEIREKNREFHEAHCDWTRAKDEAAELKKRYDRIGGELTELISRGPNPQLELPFGQYSWAAQSVAVIGLSDGIVEKLEKGGICTIGDLKQYWADGRFLDEINGIGNETAAQIADAYADYGKDHPELYGEEGDVLSDDPADEPSDDETPEEPAV